MVHRRLTMALAFVAVLFFAAPMFAQDRDDYRYGRSFQAQTRAYDYGFQRGIDRGRDDARHGRRFDYDRFREYRQGDNGYNRRFGDRDWYRDQYRRGFAAGYARGFQAYARRGYDRDDRRWYRWER